MNHSMKTIKNASKAVKLNISSTTPIGAIEAHARKALAIDIARKRAAALARRRRIQPIEQTVNMIHRSLESSMPKCLVVFTHLDKPHSEYRVIDIIDRKTKRTRSRIFFFRSTVSPKHLGSLAIYGDDAKIIGNMINESGYAFGIRVKSVEFMYGLSFFVDVKFRA